ncbi:hypothetical protein H2198_004970 [Neophaeococcomyces mojaviensis]|uniref:Uncharacterized protein n=1 Tax=Neophaeococcomyces mojaviensis TaxID=3383035 RepID=A0ACC3A701_9EURO|nr:hypothetical protein H2198_004970 [Knufia sp. JES_112]
MTTFPHILLIGATGRTGRSVITEALSRGHTVTALARNPSSLDDLLATIPSQHRSHINVVKGDPTSQSDLVNALNESLKHAALKPVVIMSTLGQTRVSGNPWSAPTSPPLFMTRAAEALIASIRSLSPSSKQQISKLVIMSMFGATDSFTNLHCALKPVMKWSNMKQTLEDHDALDQAIRGQDEVKWVMVRPSFLKEGERSEIRVLGEQGEEDSSWVPSGITRDSVVIFLLDVAVSGEWDGRTPVVVN